MRRCPSCESRLRDDPEQMGARCPRCHEPLFQPAQVAQPTSGTDEGACAVHSGNAAVGTCKRCGNFLCSLCRTRWDSRVLCVACVERLLETEGTAGGGRLEWTQSVVALLLGLAAWVMTALGLVLMLSVIDQGMKAAGFIFLGVMLFFGGGLPALLGLGFGASAIRARGNHLICATIGLFLGGLHVGVVVGFFAFSIWQM